MVAFGVDVILFLLVGLFGGAHCIGMCGPLVTVYGEKMHGQARVRSDGSGGHAGQATLTLYEVRQHALFNLGRATSYTIVGALMGALGGILFVSFGLVMSTAEMVRGIVGILFGAGIIVVGINYIGGRAGVDLRVPGLQRVMGLVHRPVDRMVNSPGIIGLGAIHGLLPCPILYPAYLFAFATGSVVAGGVALAALGIGTIPAVFLFGTVMGELDVRHRRWLHRALGVAFLVLGYVLLAHGLMSVGVHVPHPNLPFWDALGQPGF